MTAVTTEGLAVLAEEAHQVAHGPGDAIAGVPAHGPGVMCSFGTESWPCHDGEIIALRVTGEVDHLACPVLHAGLTAALDRSPRHLVVDLAGVTFCGVSGFALLVEAGIDATAHGTGYAVCGLPPRVDRHFRMLWKEEVPVRYRTTAAAVTAIRAEQTPHGPARRV